MQELEVSLFNGTKENATEALQPYEGSKLMASGGVDFKSREVTQSIRCKQRGQRDDGVMGSGKGTNSSLMMGF